MRALIFHGPNDLRFGEVPDPVVGPRDALVSIRAVSLCGSDVHGFTGATGRQIPGNVMGHEIGGIVTEVGAELDPAWIGKTVAINPVQGCGHCPDCTRGLPNLCLGRTIIGGSTGPRGGLAPEIAVNEAQLHEITRGGVVAAALTEPLAVAVRAYRHGARPSTDPMVIIGAGAIGLLLAQLGRADGREVFVLNRGARRRAIAEGLGATAFGDIEQLGLAVMERTSGHGVAVVWDAVASSQTLRGALSLTRASGAVIMVGFGDPLIDLPMGDFIRRERALLPSYAFSPEDYAYAVELINAGAIDVEMLAEHGASLEDAPALLRSLADGDVDALRALVRQD